MTLAAVIPFCPYHFDMFCLGDPLPEHVYIDLGIDTVVILRAQFPRKPGGGTASGEQFVLPGFCVWCEGPGSPDKSVEMDERSTKSTP